MEGRGRQIILVPTQRTNESGTKKTNHSSLPLTPSHAPLPPSLPVLAESHQSLLRTYWPSAGEPPCKHFRNRRACQLDETPLVFPPFFSFKTNQKWTTHGGDLKKPPDKMLSVCVSNCVTYIPVRAVCLLPSSANMRSNYFFSFFLSFFFFFWCASTGSGQIWTGATLTCLFCMVLRGYSNHMMQKTYRCLHARTYVWLGECAPMKNTPKWSKSRKALYKHRKNKSMLCKGNWLHFIWYWIMDLELLPYVGTAGVVW